MEVTQYLRGLLVDRLDKARILVWYDGERAFADFVHGFSATNCRVVLAQESRLRARREVEVIYRQLNASPTLAEARANLLIHLPFARSQGDDRLSDPFEVFAVAGAAFGDQESEQLRSLAHQAMPDMADQIERLFGEGRPTLATLDRLASGASYPLLGQVFGAQSSVEVAVRLLGDPQAPAQVSALPGCSQEIMRLLDDELGFVPPRHVEEALALRAFIARYVLLSEFTFDLPVALPDALANLPRADPRYRERINAIAERLRDTGSYRDAYIDLATRIEQELKLATYLAGVAQLGQRDTFAFQERQHLAAFTHALETDQRQAAREIIAARVGSVWRHEPERAQLWKVAERCLAFLDVSDEVAQSWQGQAASLPQMVAAYARPGGFADLDHHQQLMEQSIAECTQCEALEEVIVHCRARYREVIDALQKRFLEWVRTTGWPPEGILRQTQVFDRLVAPALAAREKTVYLLSDSLRFAMGRDLAGALSSLGEVELQPVASALPTITEVGMAALMPGADGALAMRQVDGKLVPYLGSRRLANSGDRMALLAEKYGDRVVDVEISEFLSLTSRAKQQARLQDADLVVLRDSRIDQMGEAIPLLVARKYIGDLLGDLRAAIVQLVHLGYTYIVIATDHGHVLLPDILPGDVVPASPPGEWLLRKRRSFLGSQIKDQRGICLLNAALVGIQGDVHDLAVPDGFGVYSAGSGYFHGGLSLQECVLPVITVRAQESPAEPWSTEVELRYRRDTFTSRVIGLKVWFNSLAEISTRARIEVFDGSGPSAHKVGEAADCEARDEVTHEVTLVAGQETSVPILLDPDFAGDHVEIRALDPESPVVWGRLTLQNGMLD